MDLASLLAALKPLVAAPLGRELEIATLLHAHAGLVEYEVARFFAAKALEPRVAVLAVSRDAKERRLAVDLVRVTMARAPAARVLRRLVRDRDKGVRRYAWTTVRRLRLDDVALPDSSRLVKRGATKARVAINPFTKQPMTIAARPAHIAPPGGARLALGGYNVTGWNFGYHALRRRRSKYPSEALEKLRHAEDVAELLGADDAAIARLTRAGVGPGSPYVAFEIPKATGGTRTIAAPRATLKAVQRIILRELLAEIAPHDAAHGFVEGRSTVTHAAPHARAKVLLKFDLEDFFPTIDFRRVAGIFRHYGAGAEAADVLARLVTWRPVLGDGRVAWPSVLPQGAPTSPAIANLACRRLDARLVRLAEVSGAKYTRYADDLTFSFADEPSRGVGRFTWWVDQICAQEGFVENKKKRRVLRASSQQRVTGIVVNEGLRVPREERRRFRAMLHRCRKGGVSEATTGNAHPRAYLLGYAAYVRMVEPTRGAALLAEVRALLGEGS